jgi:hypothetical protein
LEAIGLIDSINKAAINIDFGRKSFAIRGKAEEGRISYEDGIAEAMTAFQGAKTSANPETIIFC